MRTTILAINWLNLLFIYRKTTTKVTISPEKLHISNYGVPNGTFVFLYSKFNFCTDKSEFCSTEMSCLTKFVAYYKFKFCHTNVIHVRNDKIQFCVYFCVDKIEFC